MTSSNRIHVPSSFEDAGGKTRAVPEDTIRILKGILDEAPDSGAPLKPSRAYTPPALEEGGKAFGVAVQLYALRSERNWGIGDFTDLAAVMRWAAGLGAAYVGVNPLHALFLSAPGRASPYYPSSRLFLNPLYIDPDNVAVGEEAVELRNPQAEARIARARAGALIDYEAVAAAKRPALEALFAGFEAHGEPARRTQFAQFREEAGEPLHRHALFEALHEHFAAEGRDGGFHAWPEEYSRPYSPAVRAFADEKADRVAFHAYLQWIARLQLEEAAGAGVQAQPATTLYLDLAVGAAPDGSELWSGGDRYVRSCRLGAPPDPMAPQGQDWGLPPLNPKALSAEGYETLRNVLAGSMAYAGALRVDHVLGFDRQFWIPEGKRAAEGGYVAFPRDDMLAVTAEESRKARCLVVGEDLGTVPEGLTEALHEADILSYEVARWARDEDGAFLAADAYPRLCLAVASTHDIVPIAGWLKGGEIDTRAELGLWSDADEERAAREAWEEERDGLLALWGMTADAPPEEVVAAAHRFLGESRAAVVMVALEDLLLQEAQVNLPGTTDAHPNWRRRYAREISDWTGDAAVRALALEARR
ncbi:4-alpha-glucanotransferase [Parvularcula oceani]|uniref:4-alpha-glucanotransferase n=1 Tax=Parvularcula oceani TaxID=1247963 RepID=UPI00068D3557|nr:4-alpha-glucanotransferase [Parvularcula oceani]